MPYPTSTIVADLRSAIDQMDCVSLRLVNLRMATEALNDGRQKSALQFVIDDADGELQQAIVCLTKMISKKGMPT